MAIYNINVKRTFLEFLPLDAHVGAVARSQSCPPGMFPKAHVLGREVLGKMETCSTMGSYSWDSDESPSPVVEREEAQLSPSVHVTANCNPLCLHSQTGDLGEGCGNSPICEGGRCAKQEKPKRRSNGHRKINKELIAAKGTPALFNIIEKRLNDMNAINLSTATHTTKVVEALFDTIEKRAREDLQQGTCKFSPSCATIVAWSSATLQARFSKH